MKMSPKSRAIHAQSVTCTATCVRTCAFVIASALVSAQSDTCTWPQVTTMNNVPIALPSYDQVVGCFSAIPFNATWANSTLRALTHTLGAYSFTQTYTATGPPLNIRLDLNAGLASLATRVSSGSFPTDYAFQSAVSSLLRDTHDAHTVYTLPRAYDVIAALPFALFPSTVAGGIVFTMQSLTLYGVDLMQAFAPALSAYVGATVLGVDGSAPLTAVSAFVDTLSEGNDYGARFTTAMSSAKFSIRNMRLLPLPPAANITILVRRVGATSTETIVVRWLFLADPRQSIAATIASCIAVHPSLSCAQLPPARRMLQSTHTRFAERALRTVASIPEPHAPKWAQGREQVRIGNTDVVPDVASGVRMLQPDPRQLVWDMTATLGMRLMWDSGLKLLWLRISTFLPSALTSCGSPDCATDAQKNSSSACIMNAMRLLVDYGATRVFREYAARSATGLVIDLASNGGGSVAYGQLLLLSLSQRLFDTPTMAMMRYDVRRSSLLTATFRALQQQPSVAWDPLILAGSVFVAADGTTTRMQRSDVSWIDPGISRMRGIGAENYSQPFLLFPPSDFQSLIPGRPPVALDYRNLFLVTDGLCGSMCAQFLRTLHENRLARVIKMAGYPGADSDTTSAIGGFVVGDYMDEVTAFAELRTSGLTLPAGLSWPTPLLTTGRISYNYGGGISWLSSPDYAQFRAFPADSSVYAWGPSDSSAVLAQLRSALQQIAAAPVRQLDGSLAGASVLVQTQPDPSHENTIVGFAVALAFVCVLGILIIAYVSYKRHREAAQSAPLTSSPGVRTDTAATPTRETKRVSAAHAVPIHVNSKVLHADAEQVIAVIASTPGPSTTSPRTRTNGALVVH